MLEQFQSRRMEREELAKNPSTAPRKFPYGGDTFPLCMGEHKRLTLCFWRHPAFKSFTLLHTLATKRLISQTCLTWKRLTLQRPNAMAQHTDLGCMGFVAAAVEPCPQRSEQRYFQTHPPPFSNFALHNCKPTAIVSVYMSVYLSRHFLCRSTLANTKLKTSVHTAET